MKIEEIKTISLDEGDVLIVKLPEETNAIHLELFRDGLGKIFPDNKCIVYIGDIEFLKIKNIENPKGE